MKYTTMVEDMRTGSIALLMSDSIWVTLTLQIRIFLVLLKAQYRNRNMVCEDLSTSGNLTFMVQHQKEDGACIDVTKVVMRFK